MFISSLALAYSGFALFSASQPKRRAALFKTWRITPHNALLRGLAIILCGLSLLLNTKMWGITIGFSATWLVFAISAYAVVLILTYCPKIFIPLLLACLGIAGASAIFGF